MEGKLLDLSDDSPCLTTENKPQSQEKAEEPKITNDLIELSETSFCFEVPKIPKLPITTNLRMETDLLTGRPSLIFDERESLGILPQFRLPLGKRPITSQHYQFDNNSQFDPFIDVGRPSLLYDGRESLGILPQFKYSSFSPRQNIEEDLECWLQSPKSKPEKNYINKFKDITGSVANENGGDDILQKFQRDCEAIESDEFKTGNLSDKDFSVLIEANFLASKIADNSILDISQEGGSILEGTPQPELEDLEDADSLNLSEKKIDTQTVYKQVDLMLPPAETQIPNSADHKNKSNLLSHLSSLSKQWEDDQRVNEILKNTIKQISDLLVTTSNISSEKTPQFSNDVDLDAEVEDSGNSSTENDKDLQNSNNALDLSIKTHQHTSATTQALDLSFSKDSIPRRLSITFSHQNDNSLPDQPPSNKLKQQTLHMRQLWGGNNATVAASSDGSILSNESKVSASSTGSMRVKLKPKKPEADLSLKRGPLKAVVPLASLNSSITNVIPSQPAIKQRTPNAKFAPIARSTPEEYSATVKRRTASLGSPVARPGRNQRVLQRSKSTRFTAGSSTNSGLPEKPERPEKSLARGKSSTDFKQTNVETSKKPTLRRCVSVGGKENLPGALTKVPKVSQIGKTFAYGMKSSKPTNIARNAK